MSFFDDLGALRLSGIELSLHLFGVFETRFNLGRALIHRGDGRLDCVAIENTHHDQKADCLDDDVVNLEPKLGLQFFHESRLCSAGGGFDGGDQERRHGEIGMVTQGRCVTGF